MKYSKLYSNYMTENKAKISETESYFWLSLGKDEELEIRGGLLSITWELQKKHPQKTVSKTKIKYVLHKIFSLMFKVLSFIKLCTAYYFFQMKEGEIITIGIYGNN